MAVFVVERFIPSLGPEGVEAQAERERAFAEATAGIRHVRTTYLRDDELCFSVFEAPSLEALREASDNAAMPYERITEALENSADGSVR